MVTEIRPSYPSTEPPPRGTGWDRADVFHSMLARMGISEGTFRALAEQMPGVVFLEMPEGVEDAIWISGGIEPLLGYTPDAWYAIDGAWQRHLHPDDRAWVLDAAAASLDEPGRFVADYRMVTHDGGTVWVHEECSRVLDAAGEVICWYGVLLDVTEMKEAEQRAHEAEARNRSVVENLPAALYTEDLDPDWFGTSYASPQIETITGYPPEVWLEDPDLWLRIVHPDDLEAVLEQERRCVELGEPFSMDVRIVRPDGTVVWVHDETVLIHDEHGEPQYWLGFFHDVTAKKEAEQEMAWALELERRSVERLEAIDRMKDTFLTAVSHELRSPLAAIFGSAMTLEQLGDTLTDEDRTGLVAAIIGQTRRLRGLVEDLLDLDRLRHGVAVARRQGVELAAVVRDVVEATGLADRRDVVMELSELAIAIDRPMVERIVENLLTNAERYTPPGATVWVSVAPTDDGAEILVEDDGPGIPAEVRPHLFEPFRQGPNALSHSPGVGVGLSLVARFAELHGGRAWVAERPGGGASFRVTLAHADRRAGREPNGHPPA